MMPLFLFIFHIFFYNIHTYIHTITFIQYIYPSPFAEASLHPFLHRLLAQWGEPPCGAEPRIELGPALQQADALPTEPRRTIKRLFRLFRLYNETEDQPKQFDMEHILVFFSGNLGFFRFVRVCFEIVCFGCFASIPKQRVSIFRLNRNKENTNRNSLIESIFWHFNENFGLFRFVSKHFRLF
jgi:hypothetical protein